VAQAAALAALAALGGQPKADPQRILSLLRSGDPAVRPLAARAAGALHLDAAAPDLRKALEEAKARLQTGRQRWVKDTLPMRFSPGYEPAGAIGGKYKEHEEQLMAKLAAQGAHVDETGVGAVGPLFSDDTAADAALFAEAAVAAIALGATDAVDLQKELAQDPSPLVREAACRAATYLPPSAGWALLQGLGADPDAAVRSQALELLPNVLAKAAPADREAAEAFLAEGLAHTDGTVDDLLLADVGKLGGAQASPAALAALKTALERPATASQSARVLGQLATPAARAALLDRLHQEASPGLPEIVRALGELKASEAAASIRSLLFSVSPSVRAAAAGALLAMGDPQGKGEVAALREDYYASVRQAAGAPQPTATPTAAATK
jgi:HEAT repeat protein